jgi:hypothetical protein
MVLSICRSSARTITIAVSVAIGVTGTIILAVFLVLYTRNRRALKQAKISVAPSPPGISNPFDDSASESEFGVANRESWVPYLDGVQTRRGSTRASLNTISTRQLHISNQIKRARKKLADLEEMSTLLRSASHSSRGSGNSLQLELGIEAHPVPDLAGERDEQKPADADAPESRVVLENALERALREIEELNNRMQELETQRRSAWALGLSDEPPPCYYE